MRRFLLLLTISALIIPALASGCTSSAPSDESVFPDHLMINYTGNNVGAMFPCGCRIPIGGLSRRGGVIHEESPYPQVTLDAGSFAGSNTAYDRFTAGFILEAYKEIGYTAVNIGVKESLSPVRQIHEWDEMSGGVLISANLIDDQGLPVTRTHLIREIEGIKIGITGITSGALLPDGASSVPLHLDPIAPLQDVIQAFADAGVDFTILLADTSTTELEVILSAVPDIDLIVQAQEFNPSTALASVYIEETDTYLVRIGGMGKYLGRMRLDFEDDGTISGNEVIRVDLDSNSPTLSSISTMLSDFKIELRERRDEFLGDPTNPFQREQAPELIDVISGYVGESFCNQCHLGYALESQLTGHAVAWTTLPMEDRYDPECLECHTTGYNITTGLIDPDRDTHARDVTCEACHGPGGQHVREQEIIKEGLDESLLLPYEDLTGGIPFSREVPEEVCLRCHTEEWSPDFDYEEWIEEVIHSMGGDRSVMGDPETGEAIIRQNDEGSIETVDPE